MHVHPVFDILGHHNDVVLRRSLYSYGLGRSWYYKRHSKRRGIVIFGQSLLVNVNEMLW
jgi:hypothetical protein